MLEEKSRWAWEEHCGSAQKLLWEVTSIPRENQQSLPNRISGRKGRGEVGKAFSSASQLCLGASPPQAPGSEPCSSQLQASNKTCTAPPGVTLPLDTGHGPWSQVPPSLWGRQQTHADKAKARQLTRTVNKATKLVSVHEGGSSWPIERALGSGKLH